MKENADGKLLRTSCGTWPHCVTCYDSRKQNKHGNFYLFLFDLSIVAIYMESGRDVYESVVNFIFKLSLL